MEAAKRMYDNSYNERQETASLARAYLNDTLPEKKPVQQKKVKGAFLCNCISIVVSIAYCCVVFGLLLLPLLREVQLAELKVIENSYKKEIYALETEIRKAESIIFDKSNLDEIESKTKSRYNFVEKSEGVIVTIDSADFTTLQDAKEQFYNKKKKDSAINK